MEYRRPILQEMDTQEYDWVRLYIEKSPAKLYYCLAGDSGQERFIYVSTKKLAPNWNLIGYHDVSTLYYLIFLFPIKRLLVLLENKRKVYSFGIPSRSISTSADV